MIHDCWDAFALLLIEWLVRSLTDEHKVRLKRAICERVR